MLGTPLLLERPDDPFGPHLAALDTLASSSLPSHHLLIDTLRTCESALVSASLCFTPTTLSSHGALTTSTKTSLIVIQERLLEWDVMNTEELRMIRDMRAMVEWCMRGTTHQLPPSRALDYLKQLRSFIHTLSTDYHHACHMKPRSGCPYHSSCRSLDPTWHIKHGTIPHRGWDHIEMERHMQPIHNTSTLTLQTPEEEEEEWKEMLRVEKEKKEAELAAERERIARFEAEQAAANQESEEENTETESEEEDEKAGKKSKRSIRFAIEHPKPTSTPHHQPEEKEEKEESKEQEQEPPPAIVLVPVEPVIPPRRPLSFQFLCITCHTSIIRAHEIERIYGNQVYSKPGARLTNVHADVTDVWISRKQRGDDVGNDIDMEEIDRPMSPTHDDEDEHEYSQLGAGVHDYIHHQHPQDDLSRTVYGKREESMGVHCSTCTSYIGRYYPSQRYYRLIYIHRRSGVNYMYYTGDASVHKLPPLLHEKDESEDETQTDDDETQEDKDIKKEIIITPIYGLPGMYESIQQATLYPYPRFGPAQAYVMMKKHQSQSDHTSSSIKRPLSSLTRPLTANTSREVIPLSTSRPQTAGTLTHRGKTSTLLAPTLELAHQIVNMLRNTPDPLYSISVDGDDAVAQVQSLMLTSMDFNNRRSMDRVTSRILSLMSNFPGTSLYANTSKPIIPLYLDFFIKPTPDFTACRGTARYLFHFLTGKDDSKLRRHKYSLKKMIHTMMRYEDCVFHLSIGGYGGHRLVLVKLGDAYRIFQSNACLENKADRYTCVEWIHDNSRWSQLLSYTEFHHFLALFEAARAHDPHAWNILFCRGKPQQIVPSTRPMDQYRPIKDTFYCVARLQESVKRWD